MHRFLSVALLLAATLPAAAQQAPAGAAPTQAQASAPMPPDAVLADNGTVKIVRAGVTASVAINSQTAASPSA